MAQYVQLFVDQGANFATDIHLVDTRTNSAINLSGSIFSANLKASWYGANVAANFSTAIANSANGHLVISLTASQTFSLPPGRYVFDVKRVAANSVSRVREGTVIVTPGVTG